MTSEPDGSTATAQGYSDDEAGRDYERVRENAVKYELDIIQSVDRWLLTLPSGALGFTILTAGTLSGAGTCLENWSIVVALLGFGLSIATAMASKGTAYFWARRHIQTVDEAYEGTPRHQFRERLKDRESKMGTFDAWVHRLNVGCVLFFFGGLICLTVFGIARVLK